MHEGTIAQNIIKLVKAEVATRGLTAKVERIVFKAGKLNSVVSDSLRLYFDVMKQEYAQLKKTELVVEEIPITVRCKACETSEELSEPIFSCKECQQPVTVIAGQDMYIASFAVED